MLFLGVYLILIITILNFRRTSEREAGAMRFSTKFLYYRQSLLFSMQMIRRTLDVSTESVTLDDAVVFYIKGVRYFIERD